MKKLNIGIWSLGSHAKKNIIPAIIKTEFLLLVGILTRNKANSLETSKVLKCYSYKTEDEFLNDNKLNAVYISSPNSEHERQIKLCLEHNKHVLVEKTAFKSLEKAKNIINLARSRNLFVMEAFMYRFHTQSELIKKILNEKKYGEIIFYEASFGFPHLDKRNIRYSSKLYGGALSDIGAYTVSSMIEYLGENLELVYASMINERNFEVDTRGIAIFKHEFSSVVCKWGFGLSYSNNIKIWCEKGIINIERAFSKPADHEATVYITKNGKTLERFDNNFDNHFIKMLTYFCHCILNKTQNIQAEHSRTLLQAFFINEIKEYNKNKVI